MEKIALVSFGVGRGDFSQFGRFMLNATVALYYLEEVLVQAGFEVLLLDQPNSGISEAGILRELVLFQPEAVLFSQFFTTRNQVRSLIEKLKSSGIACLTGVGGHDATFHSLLLPESYKMFNLVFQGPALQKIVQVLRVHDVNNFSNPLFINTLGETEDPSSLPVISHLSYQGDVGFLKTSEGCLKEGKGCSFCTTPRFCPTGFRTRELKNVLEEIDNLKSAGKKFVFIPDDNFLGFSPKHLERGHQIIMACRQAGLKLMIMTRPERVVAASKEGFLANWQGVVFRIFIGVENGSLSGLRKLGKVTGTDHLAVSRKAVRLIKENNIAPFLGFINFPGPDTAFEDLEQSAKFIHGLGEADMTALSQNLRPYEGTEIFDRFNNLQSRMSAREVVYNFRDERVAQFHNFLLSLRSETDKMDNMMYTLTDYFSIFESASDSAFDFQLIRQRWNGLVFRLFIEALHVYRRGCGKVDVDNFLKETEALINKSRALFSKMKNS